MDDVPVVQKVLVDLTPPWHPWLPEDPRVPDLLSVLRVKSINLVLFHLLMLTQLLNYKHFFNQASKKLIKHSIMFTLIIHDVQKKPPLLPVHFKYWTGANKSMSSKIGLYDQGGLLAKIHPSIISKYGVKGVKLKDFNQTPWNSSLFSDHW